ncbi:MAG: AAA family ATPase [Bacteroidetes bacterium]|nr:AAA family ATPase [Bacteroidota bacterium]
MQSLTLPDNTIIEARKNNLRYIISGGPGFGKTSIIHELENRNFKSIHEISRSIIKDQLEKGGTILPWKDLAAFSGLVFEQRLQQHSQLLDENIHFYDRGIVDVLAYLIKDNLPIPPNYIKAAQVNHYNQLVFLTPPWKEIYLIDNERKEDFSNAEQIHNLIESTYQQLGYQTLNIPMMEVNKRVDFILNTINQHNQK